MNESDNCKQEVQQQSFNILKDVISKTENNSDFVDVAADSMQTILDTIKETENVVEVLNESITKHLNQLKK